MEETMTNTGVEETINAVNNGVDFKSVGMIGLAVIGAGTVIVGAVKGVKKLSEIVKDKKAAKVDAVEDADFTEVETEN